MAGKTARTKGSRLCIGLEGFQGGLIVERVRPAGEWARILTERLTAILATMLSRKPTVLSCGNYYGSALSTALVALQCLLPRHSVALIYSKDKLEPFNVVNLATTRRANSAVLLRGRAAAC